MIAPVTQQRLLTAVAFVGSVFIGNVCADASAPQVQLGDKTLHVEIADTAKKRTQGLSDREPLATDQGMLFIFLNDGRYSIWMKDMKFSLDIIWINRFGKVVHIEHGVHPNTYPGKTFISDEPARYVLEVLAGVGEAVKVGDAVKFKNISAHVSH